MASISSRARPCLATRYALVQPQGLANLAPDGEHRIQARHRLLEDHADLVAAERLQFAFAKRQEIAPLEPHLAGDAGGRFLQQSQDRERRNGFAAARLAQERDRLARVNREGKAVNGADGALRRSKLGLQVLHVEKHYGGSAVMSKVNASGQN